MTAPDSTLWWKPQLPEGVDGSEGVRVARIPAGIGRKKRLFEALAEELGWPGFHGTNWDALEETLRTFPWLEGVTEVWLVHADLPFSATSQNRGTYLSILRECVPAPAIPGAPRLHCVFPCDPDAES